MGDMAEGQVMDAMPGLDSLGGMAAGIDAEAAAALDPSQGQPGQPGAMPQGPDYLKGATGTVEMVRALIGGFAPGAEWDDATSVRMGASLAPVFEKYGIDMESHMPCELVALFVCGPVLYQSAKAVAFKLKMDRYALENSRPGMTDPNTVKGADIARAAESAPADSGEALAASLRDANVFPVM
ncbi:MULTISPECIES: hypothetical protein [unclassified Caballeronia]|uniref:hypothetical protein n=1 Tax=unclassified Caballeronia TaxID=2646786 RepID=UPI002027B91D|nr:MULTISPECIES: hypothetical protein [unclassified Caballeronia]